MYRNALCNKKWQKLIDANMELILAVIYTTELVVEIRLEKKIQTYAEFEPMTSVIPVQCSKLISLQQI